MSPTRRARRAAGLAGAVLALLLAGCATQPADLPAYLANLPLRLEPLLPTDVLLFGEQHDAPEHHRIEAFLVRTLAARGRLAAVAIEMAERGRSTAGLPHGASEEQVREALAWSAAGWPWEHYGPTIMQAVRAGIPVAGANLPRNAMREAMADARWDAHLPADALAGQRERIRSGHCNLLPEAQIAPMTRIQIARDAAMARTAQELLQPGRTVLLIAGGGHVLRGLGIPTHLPPGLGHQVVLGMAGTSADGALAAQADLLWATPPLPARDHCAGLRQPPVRQR